MGRRRRARLWIRWALRDARRHRLQVLSIALLLALGVGMYAAMSSMSVWRVDSADASFAALRMHDLRVSLAEGSTAPEGALRSALARSDARGGCRARRPSGSSCSTQVDASTGGRTIIVPGRIVGTPPGAEVDTLDVARRRAPADAAARVALEHNFAAPLRPARRRAADARRRATRPLRRPGARARVLHRHRARRRLRRRGGFAVVFAPLRTAQTLAGAARPGQRAGHAAAARRGPGGRAGAARRARCSGRCRAPASRSPAATRSPRTG